jgi:hypothetical protein
MAREVHLKGKSFGLVNDLINSWPAISYLEGVFFCHPISCSNMVSLIKLYFTLYTTVKQCIYLTFS